METLKLKPFVKITERERDDLEYMTAMRAVYESTVENYRDDSDDWRKIDNIVFKLEKRRDEEAEKARVEEEKRLAAEAKAEAARIEAEEKANAKAPTIEEKLTQKLVDQKIADEKMEKMVEYYERMIRDMEIYHVAADNKIHKYYSDNDKWEVCSKDANHSHYGMLDSLSQRAFGTALVNCGRAKTSTVYSFHKQDSRVLNKMSRDSWLQPNMEDTKFDNVFDVMLAAMSGGRPDVMHHIEQVIYWKYMHPEDYMLPCLSIYGVGGLSKNTFLRYVLGGIFGENQVISLSFNDLKDFSGLLVGKTFVFLDELISDDNAANKLKLLGGNPTITVNNKGGSQLPIESTAAWMTGGNDKMGNFLLDGTEADRRWSIIKSKTNVKYWTKEIYGLETDDEVKRQMHENMSVLKDKSEVAKWLGYICTKHADMKMCPDAYHAEDYDHLLDVQKNAFDDFVESVFGSGGFTWIKTSTLFTTYSLFIGEFYEGQKRWMKGRTKFFAEVNEWLEDSKLDIIKRKIKYDEDGDEHQVWAYRREGITRDGTNTDGDYLYFDKFGKKSLRSERFYDDSKKNKGDGINILPFNAPVL